MEKIEKYLYQKAFEKIDFYRIPKEKLISRDFLKKKLNLILESKFKLSFHVQDNLVKKVIHRIIGWGPLETLIKDLEITEIMVNGPHKIFFEKQGKLFSSNLTFYDDDDLLNYISRIASLINRRVDESSPMVDARLPDGSRVNAIIPPLSISGPILTIRKFLPEPFTLDKLIESKTISPKQAHFLKQCVLDKKNILISGGTSTGKTSILNALARIIPPHERIITIEDSAELKLTHQNLVSLEVRPPNLENRGEVTIRTLLKNALRMRPDRILVGEVRGEEALDMLQAMNTGHQGSLTTIHANAPLEALLRLETMSLFSKTELPLNAVRDQIFRAIDVIIQKERSNQGKRYVKSIQIVIKKAGDQTNPYFLKEIIF